MFATFMYHRISDTGIPNDINLFEQHLQTLKNRFSIMWPGDDYTGLGACLTFDDSYFDFYHYVFPMLKKLKLKAVLAVPVKYILEHTQVSNDSRLKVPYLEAMQDDVYESCAPFCTWTELQEMQQSGLVKMASHSYSHIDLTRKNCNLTRELKDSKQILSDKLSADIDTFVYPFGKMSRQIQQQVADLYPYSFRIGSAINAHWQQGLYYRHDGQRYWANERDWSRRDTAQSYFKYWQNRLRGK